MYTGFLHLHNLLRWVILVLLVIMIIRHLRGNSANNPMSASDKRLGLFLMISADITLLVGLYQWFVGGYGWKAIQNSGMAEVMKNAYTRFFSIEHPIAMILAIAFIHLGYARSKKIGAQGLHRSALIFYVVALLFLFAAVPWPFRSEVARPLFPGM